MVGGTLTGFVCGVWYTSTTSTAGPILKMLGGGCPYTAWSLQRCWFVLCTCIYPKSHASKLICSPCTIRVSPLPLPPSPTSPSPSSGHGGRTCSLFLHALSQCPAPEEPGLLSHPAVDGHHSALASFMWSHLTRTSTPSPPSPPHTRNLRQHCEDSHMVVSNLVPRLFPPPVFAIC